MWFVTITGNGFMHDKGLNVPTEAAARSRRGEHAAQTPRQQTVALFRADGVSKPVLVESSPGSG